MSEVSEMSATRPYSIHALELGPMDNFVYLIEDRATQTAAVVDPAWDVGAITALTEERGLRITDVLLTHSHHDHVNGVEAVLDHCDARLHLLKAEAEFWRHDLAQPALHHGGDRFALGETELQILHTPGHTPGSACYHLGTDLIAGDTLFVFGCGRCDLKGGDPEQMFTTLKQLKEELPSQTVIYPGHNYATRNTATMREQAEGNPFMQFDNAHDFVHYRMHEHDRTRATPYEPEYHR